TATTPPQPTQTVTVPPQSGEEATTGGTATSVLPLGNKRKRHKGNNIANTDSKGTSTTPQTGPVTTGVEQSSTCDANGDGVTDPGAPATCTPGSTTPTTGEEESSSSPAAAVYSVQLKKRSSSRSKSGSRQSSTGKSTKSTPKKRSRQPRASA
ncbi:MAG TPA: hypothetical protein VI035_00305, partial [Solirubrobacterales bacterium]